MSLRKSTCLTSQRLNANQRNARHSTGPRSEVGKQRMKLNALKHGCDAVPENDAAVMRALGEDPKQYEALKRELAAAYGPGDALWVHQLDDLARLYWRRNRIERMETGLMRDALEKVDEERRSLVRALADVTFDPSQGKAVAFSLPKPAHPLVRRRLLISLWGVIRDEVRRRVFTNAQTHAMENYYKEEPGWRPRQILELHRLFLDWAYYGHKHEQAKQEEYVKETFGDEAGLQARLQELERLVEEQIAVEQAAFAEEMAAQERKEAIARDACLAPEGKTWEMLARQEMALDRSIDRKVRIILAMRKEHAREDRGGSRTARTGTPWRAPTPGPESQDQDVAPTFRSADADLKVSATEAEAGQKAGATTLAEDPGETSKSPEQSQNVVENKGSALEEVRR